MSSSTMKISDIDIRDAFFDEVHRLASVDRNVVFMTADMGAFSLERFKAELPRQYINTGVAEQNMVSIAAGLALSGKKVFVYTIAPFVTQRCYEQIKVDICGMSLPVTIIGVGGGITYSSDGPTHHAVQDIAIMRALPGMTILSPADSTTSMAAARIAYQSGSPVYVRIDKGNLPLLYESNTDFSTGLAQVKKGRDVTIVATGIMVPRAFEAAEELAGHSIEAGIIDVYRLKPLNEALLLSLLNQSKRVVTLEEHSIIGGLGSAVCELLSDSGKSLPVKRLAISETNCPGYGDRDWMHKFYGLDVAGVAGKIVNWKI